MNKQAVSDLITWHTVDVPARPRLHGQAVELQIAMTGKPDVLIFMGMGSEMRTTARRIRLFQAAGIHHIAVVSALPYWQVNPEAADLMDLAVKGPAAAVAFLGQTTGTNRINVIAESQAAPAVIEAAVAAPEAFDGRLALIGAHGLIQLTTKRLIGRMGASILRPRLSVSGYNAGIGGKVALRIVQDLARNGAQLEFGLTTDSSRSLQKLHHSRPQTVRIFSGRDDRLFPPQEIVAQLKAHGLEGILEVVPGGHAIIDSKASIEEYKRILEWCRS